MFRFKQFTLEQDQCAMKVCTDSCILGAFTPVRAGIKVLDIGTGTGLLSLMLAQKNKIKIDAIEIDKAAAIQAGENIERSIFKDHISLYHTDIKEFEGNNYDLIITNPPFFEGQLLSPDLKRNKAIHNCHLSFADLAQIIAQKLSPDGDCSVLLPPDEMKSFEEKMAIYALNPSKTLSIKHHSEKPIFRKITLFSRKESEPEQLEICIYETDGRTYTDDFKALLKDYYIIF